MSEAPALRLVVGNYNYSSWSLRPWILIQHLGLPCQTIRVLLDSPSFKDQVRKHSPAGRVPVLLHHELSVWESVAILEYLNELSAGKAYPSERAERAYARALVAEMHAGFAALRRCWPMNLKATRRVAMNPDLQADINRINAIFTDCRTRFKARGEWLMGEYSAVDAMHLPVVMRFKTYATPDLLSPLAKQYVEHAAADPLFAPWLAWARAETEVVVDDEVGSPHPDTQA